MFRFVAEILIRFTVSYMAVLTVWTFVSATLGSSVPLFVLHRRHRRFLWRSCALLSGSDCRQFFRVRHCIPEVRNSQCHKQNHTKSGGAGKRICFSCRRLLPGGVSQHQNSLTQEQLECLEKVAVTCGSDDRKIVLSIIHEFGSYCGSFT